MCLAGVLGVLLLSRTGPRESHARRILLVVGGVGLAAVVLFNNAPFLIRERATSLLDPSTVITARGFLMGEVAPFLMRHPLGAGMGKIVPAGQLLSALAGVAPDAYASENMLYAMSVELGLFGAAFVIVLWFAIGRGAIRRIRRGSGTPQSDLGYVVSIAFAAAAFAGPLIVAQPANLVLWIFATCALLETGAAQETGSRSP
jgi:hypothetical protein